MQRSLRGTVACLIIVGCRSVAAPEAPAQPAPNATGDEGPSALAGGQPPPIIISVDAPRFRRGEGPRIAVDEGHHEVHSLSTTYRPFATVLRQEGYRVEAYRAGFTAAELTGVDLLVIANALHASNVERWELPTPSAFDPEEIAALVAWVEGGGRLWLIADHMPFPGAADALARALGFTFHNGFAFTRIEGGYRGGPEDHRRADGTVLPHAVTAGVDQVRSFTGQAFEAPRDADVLLTMPDACVLLLTRVAWVFDGAEERPCPGWPIAAVRTLGRGRVAVFGEAAMLSARWAETPEGYRPVGFQAEEAVDNVRLLRNVAAWLTEAAEGGGESSEPQPVGPGHPRAATTNRYPYSSACSRKTSISRRCAVSSAESSGWSGCRRSSAARRASRGR